MVPDEPSSAQIIYNETTVDKRFNVQHDQLLIEGIRELAFMRALPPIDGVIDLLKWDLNETGLTLTLPRGLPIFKALKDEIITIEDVAVVGLKALTNLHRTGLLHGDLKPDNFVVINGRPVLIDLGLAKFVKRTPDGPCVSGVMYTEFYRDPEYCATIANIDHPISVEMYAFARTLYAYYEFLSGVEENELLDFIPEIPDRSMEITNVIIEQANLPLDDRMTIEELAVSLGLVDPVVAVGVPITAAPSEDFPINVLIYDELSDRLGVHEPVLFELIRQLTSFYYNDLTYAKVAKYILASDGVLFNLDVTNRLMASSLPMVAEDYCDFLHQLEDPKDPNLELVAALEEKLSLLILINDSAAVEKIARRLEKFKSKPPRLLPDGAALLKRAVKEWGHEPFERWL